MVHVQYYNPKEVFLVNNEMIGRTHNFYLLKAFFNSRRNDEGNFTEALDSNNFVRNAGAVQIFNISGIDTLRDPHHCISSSFHTANGLSSYGHSERKLIRDALDNFIANPRNNGEIERPSYYVLSPNPAEQPLEILQALVNHTNEYKQYLTQQDAIVKMWSERKPCNYDLVGGGGRCADFIQNILPDNSEYGYITDVPLYAKTAEIAQLNEVASGNFRQAYLDEVSALGLIDMFENFMI